MRIQYMSDLHLEFQENSRYLRYNELPVTGDVLVLAGDIFYLKDKTGPVMNFWKWASKNYRQVLIVPGNHEYYNYSDVMERGFQWKWMLRENVGYYQNQAVRIDDTDFILSTLWSHINPNDEYFVWKGMNDFRQIKFGGNPADFKRFCLIGYFYIGKHARPFKFFVRDRNGAPERADIRASGRQNGRGGGAGMRTKPIRRGRWPLVLWVRSLSAPQGWPRCRLMFLQPQQSGRRPGRKQQGQGKLRERERQAVPLIPERGRERLHPRRRKWPHVRRRRFPAGIFADIPQTGRRLPVPTP